MYDYCFSQSYFHNQLSLTIMVEVSRATLLGILEDFQKIMFQRQVFYNGINSIPFTLTPSSSLVLINEKKTPKTCFK